MCTEFANIFADILKEDIVGLIKVFKQKGETKP